MEVIITRGEDISHYEGSIRKFIEILNSQNIPYSKITISTSDNLISWFEIEFPRGIIVYFPGYTLRDSKLPVYLKGISKMIEFVSSNIRLPHMWKESFCYIIFEDERSAEEFGCKLIREALDKKLAVFAYWCEESLWFKENIGNCELKRGKYLCKFKCLSIDCGYPDYEDLFGISFNLLIVERDKIKHVLKALGE